LRKRERERENKIFLSSLSFSKKTEMKKTEMKMVIDIKKLRKRYNIPWNRKFIWVRNEKVSMHGRYWSGGSRDEYYIISPEMSKRVPDAPFPNPSDEYDNYTIPPETAVLNLGIFCGKPATPVLFIRPEDSVIEDEKTVKREY
jgi:hypothetical protein